MKNILIQNSKLSFYDKGVDLPMGIKFWNHFHSVSQSGDEVYIEDLFEYRHKSKIVEMMLYICYDCAYCSKKGNV